MCKESLRQRTSVSNPSPSLLLPRNHHEVLPTKLQRWQQRRRREASTRCINPTIGIVLLFVIIIVNSLILGYKLGQHIAEEDAGTRQHDLHKVATGFLTAITAPSHNTIQEEEQQEVVTTTTKANKPTIIAFLRISKTGSTTLSTFINLKTPLRGLYTQINDETNHKFGDICDCLYSFDHRTEVRQSSNKHLIQLRQSHQCFHGDYNPMMKQVQHLSHELNQDWENKIRWVSMIRDPYERLVSLFHFSKDNDMYPFNPQQLDMIKNDDLHGWMESLTEHHSRYIAYQHMQFQERGILDLEKSLSLTADGEMPTILTLVNECFEASLRLFVEEFGVEEGNDDAGTGTQVDIIQDFVNSSRFNERKRPQIYSAHHHHTHDDDDELRSKALEWFHDDFVFYDKVVEQFKLRIEASVKRSGGNEKHFRSCKFYESSS